MMRIERGNTQSLVPLFAVLLAFRLANAFSVATFFQPDEYFQSLEPAWLWAFGESSGAWITWEWKEFLRSSLHPLLFTTAYQIADLVCMLISCSTTARSKALIAAPKVLQALIATLVDYFTYALACRVWPGQHVLAITTLLISVVSPWQWFCSVRTFSNCLETALTTIALAYWPWNWYTTTKSNSRVKIGKSSESAAYSNGRYGSTNLHLALITAAIACLLRPTNIIIWLTMVIVLALQNGNISQLLELMKASALCGFPTLIASLSLDRLFYGKFVFPPFRFLYFNIVQSLAKIYGQNRPDYYLTEGLPLLLTTMLPFMAVGVWRTIFPTLEYATYETGFTSLKMKRVFLYIISASVLLLSLVSHKEVRFIYPLLPMLHILAAAPLASFLGLLPRSAKGPQRAGFLLVIAVNILIAYYVGNVHQRGVVDVIHFLRHEYEARLSTSGLHPETPSAERTTIGFLMPCHSTPWRSHLVYTDIQAWALTCEPPLHLKPDEKTRYLDEADLFYLDPASWIEQNMQSRQTIIKNGNDNTHLTVPTEHRSWPQYLVFFENLELTLTTLLANTTYERCWRGFNTHWHDDRRRYGDVVVWCLPREVRRS